MSDQFTFQSEVDGFALTGYRWDLPEPSALVVIAHGAAEHAQRYARFAGALNQAGFAVWALDHRGHGASPGPEGLGDFGDAGWDGLVADIGQLLRLAKAAHPGLPAALFGHSMGSFALQQLVPDCSADVDAVVLSGSTLRRPSWIPETELPDLKGNFNAPFEPARTPYDWLSRDPDEVDLYIADNWCGFDKWRSSRNFSLGDGDRLADPARLARIRPDLPVLLLAGDCDPINHGLRGIDALERAWRDAGVRQIDRAIYPGGRHEMLNETNRDEVCQDVVRWLSDALP